MSPPHDPSAYLAAVRERARARSALEDTLDLLARRQDALARLPDAEAGPGLARLAQKRLLASNTLVASNRADRLAWDAANEWIAARLRADVPWSTSELLLLNERLTGAPAVLRTEAIHSGPDAYLVPERVGPELALLGGWMQDEPADTLLSAAVVYISVVTIHPFTNANGRTARLAADRVLLGAGVLPLCFLSPIASHVAQLEAGPVRDPVRSLRLVLAAIDESYATVLNAPPSAS